MGTTFAMAQPYDRVYNFSAGPGTLPVEVLEQVRDELLSWRGCGMSVMEMSHRSKEFESIISEAEADLRTLLNIPEEYVVLFLQGGASTQFSLMPMNFASEDQTVDMIITGSWGKKAREAASFVCKPNVVWDGKETNYDRVPDGQLPLSVDPAYLHITTNETIQGVEFHTDTDYMVPTVADMSSDFLSRPLEVSRYAAIYAGAQKNMGPAGATVVIIRKDMLERVPELPPMFSYKVQAENKSLYNTPPTFSIYVCGLVYKWLLKKGGLPAIYQQNQLKAQMIYEVIDASNGFYTGHAQPASRSLMNVTFRLPSDDLTQKFLSEAKANRMVELKGHRSVGGCRASIYNAFPVEGCSDLANFMKEFASNNSVP
jgi:phosphoserine aminotransferase